MTHNTSFPLLGSRFILNPYFDTAARAWSCPLNLLQRQG